MSMGIVSDSEFESEMDQFISPILDNAINHPPSNSHIDNIGIVKEIEKPGRKEGDNNVPESIRKLIGETANIEGRGAALELARGFGISDSSTSAYSNGSTSTSTYDKKDKDLIEYITSRKGKHTKTALKKLGHALALMDVAKLHDCTAPQLAHVANVMSNVVKNLEPSKVDNPINPINNNGPTIIVMAPPLNSEDKYATIHSRE